ncbi:MAG: NAD(P)H-dependent glycerol-3-phosphate dehydrogenase [Acetobacteraceae bacterium]|nr:NAD(P)H-dependent glycerol-3-phosphate dehydrogenase [Acetobacteraceae bacterium]
MNELTVVGAGAWGTALAIQAVRAGGTVRLWARDRSRAEAMASTRENPRLPGFALPPSVAVVSDPRQATGLRLTAVPVQHLRAVLQRLPREGPIVVCAKGVESGTLRFPAEVVAETHPGTPYGVLTGPNFAHEIAAGLPGASVIACPDATLREQVIVSLGTPTFRLYGNDDTVGVQVGGAAKNVIAIAAGAVIGARLGENARAALITRGLAELGRAAAALGGRAETVMGLSGLGDLLLTCTGPASRNFSLGVALGRGERLPDVLASRTAVTEGVATAPALVARAAGVDMPICRAVAALLDGRTTLAQAISELLARPRRDE